MEEFVATAAGHSSVEQINKSRIHNFPVETFNRAAITLNLYQIHRAQIMLNTIEGLGYPPNAVQMLKQRGSVKSADMHVVLK